LIAEIAMRLLKSLALLASGLILTGAAPDIFSQTPTKADCSRMKVPDVAAMREYKRCLASQLEPLEPKRRDWYGEQYDPKKYLECVTKEPMDASCDRYKLKRRSEPEYWPYLGKAPPVKWPQIPSQSVYRKGMSPKEYFDALCKSEAGEFVYRTVENVEGVYQIRPRLKASTYELRDRHVMEDPYGYSNAEATEPHNHLVQPPIGKFHFLEIVDVRAGPATTHIRFFRGEPIPGKKTQYMEKRSDGTYGGKVVPYVVRDTLVKELSSRYGYTWRGIKRPNDRENSIAGGELIVVDLSSNEVLGLRRGFAMTRTEGSRYGPNWEVSSECPPHILGSHSYQFIFQVLKPAK
jgi:hypothetical protein